MSKNKYIDAFSSHLFWDVDKSKLDVVKHKEQIILKVLEYGLMSDWMLLQKLYSKDVMKKVVIKLRNMDEVTLSFVSHIYQIPKTDFRCYQNKQSVNNFWNS